MKSVVDPQRFFYLGAFSKNTFVEARTACILA